MSEHAAQEARETTRCALGCQAAIRRTGSWSSGDACGSTCLVPAKINAFCQTCCLCRRLAEGCQLDSVAVTSACGATCVVPIVWELETGSGVVWFRAMYLSLRIKRPEYNRARNQLKQGGGRLCNAGERRLLLTVPGSEPSTRYMRSPIVVSIDAACQWLREVGEVQAAEQLSQHPQPLPTAANGTGGQQGLNSSQPGTALGAHMHASATNVRSLPSQHVTPGSDRDAGQGGTLQRASRLGAEVSRCFNAAAALSATLYLAHRYCHADMCCTLIMHPS